MGKNSKEAKTIARLEALQTVTNELIRSPDPNHVLKLIVEKALQLLSCEAGSLYLKHDEKHLVFEVAVNYKVKFEFEKVILPISKHGFASYCYRTGEAFKVENVYKIDPKAPYSFDDSFDKATGYKTRSILVHPIITARGETLGVIQLINPVLKHNGKEIPKIGFTEDDQEFLKSFAAVAASSIENARLYKSIKNMCEGLVRASVNTIESRDPATRGHSERVALLTVNLARSVDRASGELGSVKFSSSQLDELRYAALLHDFGKIGVSEQTLLKAEKLLDWQKALIQARLEKFIFAREIQLLRTLITQLRSQSRGPSKTEVSDLEDELKRFRSELGGRWTQILDLNRSSVLDENRSSLAKQLAELTFWLPNGEPEKLLTQEEMESLNVLRGSLTESERLEIQSHVTNTYLFLKEIPWGKEFSNVPEFAYGHHEKLDGSGYPRKLKASKIPIQTRMMTICDIFDALVASDRPYKPPVPLEKALAILESEVKAGKLDPQCFAIFTEARVYEERQFSSLLTTPLKRAA